ncbi:MAG: polysaccharide biosynthesis/export family protein [Phycisphaerales bacterium]
MPSSDNQPIQNPRTGWKPRRPARAVALAGLTGLLALAACQDVDSWLFNPSVVGRWEETPTIVPVLERIDVIENDTGDFVEITQVTRDDLMPQPIESRIKPGDALRITILDFPEAGAAGEFDRVVDALGFIDLPLMPRIKVGGQTQPRIQAIVERALVDARLLDRPVVQVETGSQDESTFRIFGVVEKPGQFRVPGPDYRLLQAITDAGGVSPVVRKIYVIRQVSLADELEGTGGAPTPEPSGEPGMRPAPSGSTPRPSQPAPSAPDAGEDLLKVIDDLTAEPVPETPAAAPEQPATPPTEPPAAAPGNEQDELLGALSNDAPRASSQRRQAPAKVLPRVSPSMSAHQDGDQPMIDLPESTSDSTVPVAPQPLASEGGTTVSGGQWVFLNGEWVRVFKKMGDAAGGLPEGRDPLSARSSGVEDILTQRVIEVPVGPLLQGAAQYNLVVRPGDVINVPGPDQGFVYAEGPGINRIGVYGLPQAGQLTIQRLVAAAGGLSEIAVPERVDITRRVGDKRQATVRLNLRAIYEGTQPDIVLKSDDLVNFGTNFWATPMAIVRNGFRMTYGFGFLLDRNFGSDVFGVPPESVSRGFGG